MATETHENSTVELRELLARTPVRRAMQLGFFECAPDTDVAEVAAMLAAHRVHCLVVPDVDHTGDRRVWATVSDREVLGALIDGAAQRSAGAIARRDAHGVAPGDSLLHAACVMASREVAHLVVLSPGTERPVGIVSSLDLARVAGELARGVGR